MLQKIDLDKVANFHYHSQTKELQITGGEITSNDELYTLLQFIKKKLQIEGLNLSNNHFNIVSINMLADYLNDCPQITSLILSNNNIDDQGMQLLASIPHLRHIDVSHNKISKEGAKFLAEKNNLLSLNINYNQIGCKVISDIIASNPSLSTLNIRSCFYYQETNNGFICINSENDQAVIAFTEACKKNSNITSLDISGNYALKGNLKALLPLKLTTLTAQDIELDNDDMKVLTEITTLKSLDIADNNIGDEGMKFISTLTSLESLYVRSNQINAEGAKAIALLPELKTLVINYNKIEDEGATALLQNKTITFLEAHYCNASDKIEDALILRTFSTAKQSLQSHFAKLTFLNEQNTKSNLKDSDDDQSLKTESKSTIDNKP